MVDLYREPRHLPAVLFPFEGSNRAGNCSAVFMSDEFIETGQTFTDEGAAYCPIERKERGAAGVAASLAVLAGGAAFLTYAMLGAPAPVASAPTAAAPAAATSASVEPVAASSAPMDTAATQQPDEQHPAVTQTTDTGALVAEALAESRAARAGVDSAPYSFGAPRLKPAFERQIAAAPSARITPIGGVAKATTAKIDPAVIFLPADRALRHLTPAVAYARDIARDTAETTITIARGETFVDALKRAGIAAADRNTAAYAFGKHYNLRRLKPGQQFQLRLGWVNQTLFQLADQGEPEARLLSLSFRDGFEQKIDVTRASDGAFDAEATPIELTNPHARRRRAH